MIFSSSNCPPPLMCVAGGGTHGRERNIKQNENINNNNNNKKKTDGHALHGPSERERAGGGSNCERYYIDFVRQKTHVMTKRRVAGAAFIDNNNTRTTQERGRGEKLSPTKKTAKFQCKHAARFYFTTQRVFITIKCVRVAVGEAEEKVCVRTLRNIYLKKNK